MKTTLESQLPLETEELRAAIQALAWKRCLDSVAERVVAWRCGKPIEFLGRKLEEEVVEMQPVLGFLTTEVDRFGLNFDP
jgi:hypothetical protein